MNTWGCGRTCISSSVISNDFLHILMLRLLSLCEKQTYAGNTHVPMWPAMLADWMHWFLWLLAEIYLYNFCYCVVAFLQFIHPTHRHELTEKQTYTPLRNVTNLSYATWGGLHIGPWIEQANKGIILELGLNIVNTCNLFMEVPHGRASWY